ncbi:MAG: hypothetical protein ABI813_02110 [Bacteroidota bacterium]
MNKKENLGDVLSKRTTVRYTNDENQTVKNKADDAGLSFSDFCRQMTIEGYVQAVPKTHDLNEIRLFKNVLIEYRTNFSRISNLIKVADPGLHLEISRLKDSLTLIIEKIKL